MDSFQREERNGRKYTSRSINLPQGESHRDNSMLVKRATSEDVYGAKRPPDLRDMVRAKIARISDSRGSPQTLRHNHIYA